MLIATTRYDDCEAALAFLTGVLGLRDPEGHVWSFGDYDPFAADR